MRLNAFRAALPQGELWVFGYGSLMWSPCFTYRERHLARLHGYHRDGLIQGIEGLPQPAPAHPGADQVRPTGEMGRCQSPSHGGWP